MRGKGDVTVPTLLRPLQISMTVLVGFSAIVLALAEGGPIAGVSVPLSLATLYFIDIHAVIAAPVVLANLGGVLAFAVAGYEFFNGGIEARLLAGGHLLVYLTWIYLLRRKGEREYWWLLALCTLEMALASVLTDSVWFGFGIAVFAMLVTWTMAVFLLYRSTDAAANEAVIERSWNPTRQRRGLAPFFGRSRAGVSSDVDQRLLNARFVGTTLVMTCLALAMSATIFLLTPRVWIGNFTIFGDAPLGGGRSLTGFTDEVRLGDLGEILESSEPVMEVRLFHPDGQPMTPEEGLEYLGEEPLFRGAVLERYQNGRWIRAEWDDNISLSSREPAGAIRQQIILEPIGVPTLFAYGNVVTVTADGNERIRTEVFAGEYFRAGRSQSSRRFQYTVHAYHGAPDQVHSQQRANWPRPVRGEFVQYLGAMTAIESKLDRLAELARQVVGNAKTPQEAADRLLKHLKYSAEYSYSMALSVNDPSVDPVEDFLFNRKAGHCEYYASALALMLRSVGIPARVASGFKGASQNESRNVFLVQQLHAHTWVEAMLGGRWVVFDPTPAARDQSVSQMQGSGGIFSALRMRLQNLWATSTRMSQSQQRELIYRPLQDTAVRSWSFAKGLVAGNERTLQQAMSFLRDPHRWISWQGGVVAFVLMTGLSGVLWLIRRLWRSIAAWQQGLKELSIRATRVAFYERFRTILEEQGIHQSPTETAREFARNAMSRFNGRLAAAGLAEWPAELADRFYDVRFGGRDLDADELRQIDSQLSELERVLEDENGQS